jgi:GT2 family glycosyltransferase/glycosyltransferase involved in cell wall biosynthesis
MPKVETEGRIFVVLGMHRSGTSACTRSLQALGVEMGDQLLAPVADQNPRGFFEDEPLLQISDRLLEVLGMGWDSPRLIPEDVWNRPEIAELELQAVRSLRERFEGVPDLGFKNPRTARLLPFWNNVFERAGRSPAYLIVLRNPLSVAESLHRRNGMSPPRAHLLWLLHMTEAVVRTRGQRRLCVDYDLMMSAPDRELRRVAEGLGLSTVPEDSPDLHEFAEDFLSEEFRNSKFSASDLELAPHLAPLALTAHGLLSRWSTDDPSLSSTQLQRGFGQIYGRLRKLEPVFADLSDTDRARQVAVAALDAERTALGAERVALEELRASADVQARELARVLHESGELRSELDVSRERTAQLQAESEKRDREIQESLGVSTLLASRLETTDRELARSQDRLEELRETLETQRLSIAEITSKAEQAESTSQSYARQIEDLDRLKETQAGEIANLQTLQASLIESHRDELERAGNARRSERDEWERRLTGVSSRIAEIEADRAQGKRVVGELRRERDARDLELEHLKETRDAEIDAARAWIRGQAMALTADLVDKIDAISQTRQWTLTRSVQRRVSRLRRRGWVDGMAQLQTLARALQAEAQRDRIDVRFLAALVSDVRRTLGDLSSGEIFRLSRSMAAIRYAIRLSKRPEGPFEFVRSRIGELEFYFQHLSSAPDGATEATRREEVPEIGAIVDIVIPVYKAREETLRCIRSVLESKNRTPHEIIVIDDGSGDSKLSRKLANWADEGVLTVLRNDRNLGFPATANRGLSQHADRDVVLLNSDTMVHGDWLDRLRRSAHRDWKIATATPFSNNAEICSYPVLCRADPMPSPEALAELDDRAARTNRSLGVTIPTAVGFCMYIRREVLREVGLFDVDRFGRGYGEENDFCLRARAHGYRHVLAADVFVAHEGGISFSDEKTALIEEGLAEIDQLHPGYRSEIQSFLAKDPIRWLRQRLDLERVAPQGRPAMLMVSHSKGGGTHRHVLELASHLEAEGVTVLLLQPSNPGVVRLSRPEAPAAENLEFRLPEEFDGLVEALRASDVHHVHIQHMLGLDPSVIDIAAALGCEYDATLHDYVAICPRVHVMDDRGRYCELPPVKQCNACVKRNGSDVGFEVDVEKWRREHQAWLSGARKVFVPSEDARSRLASLLPDIEFTVRPHAEIYDATSSFEAPSSRKGVRRALKGPRRVAVIGAIGPHKGSEILHACALDAAERDLPIEFHLIGFSDRDQDLLETKKVSISGHYEEHQLEGLLRKARCELAFIPSVWPETFCYTLSETFRWRIYPVAFDLGAIAQRVSTLGWGDLIPLESSAEEVNDRLLALEPEAFPERPTSQLGAHYPNYLDDYYDGVMSVSPATGPHTI